MVRRARDMATAFIEGLGPTDLAAVVFTRDNRNAQDFTRDRARLLAAANRLSGGFLGGAVPSSRVGPAWSSDLDGPGRHGFEATTCHRWTRSAGWPSTSRQCRCGEKSWPISASACPVSVADAAAIPSGRRRRPDRRRDQSGDGGVASANDRSGAAGKRRDLWPGSGGAGWSGDLVSSQAAADSESDTLHRVTTHASRRHRRSRLCERQRLQAGHRDALRGNQVLLPARLTSPSPPPRPGDYRRIEVKAQAPGLGCHLAQGILRIAAGCTERRAAVWRGQGHHRRAAGSGSAASRHRGAPASGRRHDGGGDHARRGSDGRERDAGRRLEIFTLPVRSGGPPPRRLRAEGAPLCVAAVGASSPR